MWIRKQSQFRMRNGRGMADVIRFLGVLRDLIFPRACAGCGEWDHDLCPACTELIAAPLRDVAYRAPYLQHVVPASEMARGDPWKEYTYSRFPVYAPAEYRGAPRQAMITWKNTNNREVSAAMMSAFTRACGPLFEGSTGGRVLVIPAPSRWRRVHQGRFVARTLAQGCADAAREAGWEAEVQVALRSGRRYGSGRLDARKVKADRIHTARHVTYAGEAVILVDDVLTTGATLAACARALAKAGASVSAAVVVAVAPDPRNVDANSAAHFMLGRK